MKKMLTLVAGGEAGFGLVLLVYPPIVVRLLFNAPIEGVGMVMGRVAGIVFIALGVACWPGSSMGRALAGIVTYSTVVALYLIILGIEGEWVGKLLWPAVVVHLTLSVFLTWGWFRLRKGTEGTAF